MANWGFSTNANGYDANDRLINWNRADSACDQSWTLTYAGDWRYFTEEATTEDRTHAPTHELIAIDATTLTYDAKGNLTKNVSGDEYAWDFDNRMRTATVSGAVSTYSYDALGRRTSKEVGAANTVFVSRTQGLAISPFAGQVVAEYSSGAAPASPTEKYAYGSYIDEPIIKVGTGGTVYYHASDLFSIGALTDTGGSAIERYAYTAYGVLTILEADGSTVRSSSSYANPYTFTGRRWDAETKLYYYRHRGYAPHLGRFCSRDPIGYMRNEPSLYSAMSANPTRYTDPLGLASLACVKSIRTSTPWVYVTCGASKTASFPTISPGQSTTQDIVNEVTCVYSRTVTTTYCCSPSLFNPRRTPPTCTETCSVIGTATASTATNGAAMVQGFAISWAPSWWPQGIPGLSINLFQDWVDPGDAAAAAAACGTVGQANISLAADSNGLNKVYNAFEPGGYGDNRPNCTGNCP